MPAQALAALATVLAAVPHGNRIELQLDRGSAEIVWSTAATFHFRRTLNGPLGTVSPREPKQFDLTAEELADAFRFRTKYLEVSIRKSGVLVAVRKRDGTPLTQDLSEPREIEHGVEWERQAPEGARFFGLGPRAELEFGLGGKSWPADVPFLMSTAGYGESHFGAGAFRFDFTSPGRYRIQAPAVDYLFHFGPAIKQILEIEHDHKGTPPRWNPLPEAAGTWDTLRASLLRMVHGAMSGLSVPEFELAPYANAPADLKQRARQLGTLVREVSAGPVGLSPFRAQIASYLRVYDVERDSRGYPIWHPLPFQFPNDLESERHADEFMFGDELLAAPVYTPGNRRSVYLPPGNWTNLETNEVFPGRRTITVDTASLPLFARNGMVVPFDAPPGMTVHYFPSLGGEFFLLEEDMSGWTQLHASPAADVIRLEIESKKGREYRWVVHHIDKPSELEYDGKKLTQAARANALGYDAWFYDAALRNLHVRLSVGDNEDRIVNVLW
jgi:hypothetical protein